MVEAILALAVAVAISTGIVIAVVTALSGAGTNQNSNFSLNFAQEASDLIRDQAASDFGSFHALTTGYYCFGDDDALNPNAAQCPLTGTNLDREGNKYLRRIYINQSGCDSRSGSCSQDCASGTVFVASIVSWSDAKCRNTSSPNCHSVEIDSCITDTNSITAP